MQKKPPQLNCHTCSGRSKGIFCDLKRVELDKLDAEKNANYYKKGQSLFLSGNPPYGLYCIHKGQVKVSKINSDGKETIVRIVGEGGVLGHRSLFSESPYTATATVMSDSVICFVSKSTMQGLIQDDPRLSYKIISRVSDEMGAAEDKLASMARKSVRERFAETLLLLKENFGVQEGSRIKLDVSLTREEMASMVGAASENITRLITDYKNEGYISQEGKVLFVEDVEALEREAALGY
jgi:CRP-like cAMP-binding protein